MTSVYFIRKTSQVEYDKLNDQNSTQAEEFPQDISQIRLRFRFKSGDALTENKDLQILKK